MSDLEVILEIKIINGFLVFKNRNFLSCQVSKKLITIYSPELKILITLLAQIQIWAAFV